MVVPTESRSTLSIIGTGAASSIVAIESKEGTVRGTNGSVAAELSHTLVVICAVASISKVSTVSNSTRRVTSICIGIAVSSSAF